MRIGIDIDGVLTDSQTFVIEYGTKFCIENNLSYKIKEDKYDSKKALSISAENELKFWNAYLKKYVTETRPREFAKEVIDKLKDEGNEIYLVTARNEWGFTEEDDGKMHDYTKKWLLDNDIYFDKIIYTEGSKVPYAIGNYIDIMIEDAPRNVKDLAKKIPVICFNNHYNNSIKGKRIKRAYSWYEVYDLIKNSDLV